LVLLVRLPSLSQKRIDVLGKLMIRINLVGGADVTASDFTSRGNFLGQEFLTLFNI
jgi:hypothetical protein